MFRVGDEVEAIHLRPLGTAYDASLSRLRLRETYTVSGRTSSGTILLSEVASDHPNGSWNPTRFRKVERRNDSLSIEAFLTIKPGFEEPRRETNTPAKPKERV